MELFIVEDEVLMGRGVFGVFSTIEKAKAFMDGFQLSSGFRCAIKKLEVQGSGQSCNSVCVAYSHDCIHDVYLLDGLYAIAWDAYEATGDRGLIVEFVIDSPESKRTIQDV